MKKNSSGKLRPPRLPLVFFRWFCHPHYREDIEGDLLERFTDRVTKIGVKKANWLFIKDVLSLFRPGIIGLHKSSYQKKINTMKRVNWITLLSFNLLVTVMIISPFIPGPSNKVVFWLSILGQITGTFGLLLVPIGLAWLIVERRKLGNKKSGNRISSYHLAIASTLFIMLVFALAAAIVPNPMPKISFLSGLLLVVTGFVLALQKIQKWEHNKEQFNDGGASYILAVSAISCISFIYLLTSVFVLVGIGIIPGIIMLLLLLVGFALINNRVKLLKTGKQEKFNPMPLYLMSVPVIAFLGFMFLITPLSDFSRNFAIQRSQVLITLIEEHKNKTGEYPVSIDDLDPRSVQKKAKTNIMGIENYRYTKINDHYSLSFSQWKDLGSLEEIVLYDKNNLKDNLIGEFAKYDYSLDLHRVKGAFASHDTRYDNWRYYLVD
jgi:hypothetical protein